MFYRFQIIILFVVSSAIFAMEEDFPSEHEMHEMVQKQIENGAFNEPIVVVQSEYQISFLYVLGYFVDLYLNSDGKLEDVENALKKGANPNVSYGDLLGEAVDEDNSDFLQLLLSYGANPHEECEYWSSVYHYIMQPHLYYSSGDPNKEKKLRECVAIERGRVAFMQKVRHGLLRATKEEQSAFWGVPEEVVNLICRNAFRKDLEFPAVSEEMEKFVVSSIQHGA